MSHSAKSISVNGQLARRYAKETHDMGLSQEIYAKAVSAGKRRESWTKWQAMLDKMAAYCKEHGLKVICDPKAARTARAIKKRQRESIAMAKRTESSGPNSLAHIEWWQAVRKFATTKSHQDARHGKTVRSERLITPQPPHLTNVPYTFHEATAQPQVPAPAPTFEQQGGQLPQPQAIPVPPLISAPPYARQPRWDINALLDPDIPVGTTVQPAEWRNRNCADTLATYIGESARHNQNVNLAMAGIPARNVRAGTGATSVNYAHFLDAYKYQYEGTDDDRIKGSATQYADVWGIRVGEALGNLLSTYVGIEGDWGPIEDINLEVKEWFGVGYASVPMKTVNPKSIDIPLLCWGSKKYAEDVRFPVPVGPYDIEVERKEIAEKDRKAISRDQTPLTYKMCEKWRNVENNFFKDVAVASNNPHLKELVDKGASNVNVLRKLCSEQKGLDELLLGTDESVNLLASFERADGMTQTAWLPRRVYAFQDPGSEISLREKIAKASSCNPIVTSIKIFSYEPESLRIEKRWRVGFYGMRDVPHWLYMLYTFLMDPLCDLEIFRLFEVVKRQESHATPGAHLDWLSQFMSACQLNHILYECSGRDPEHGSRVGTSPTIEVKAVPYPPRFWNADSEGKLVTNSLIPWLEEGTQINISADDPLYQRAVLQQAIFDDSFHLPEILYTDLTTEDKKANTGAFTGDINPPAQSNLNATISLEPKYFDRTSVNYFRTLGEWMSAPVDKKNQLFHKAQIQAIEFYMQIVVRVGGPWHNGFDPSSYMRNTNINGPCNSVASYKRYEAFSTTKDERPVMFEIPEMVLDLLHEENFSKHDLPAKWLKLKYFDNADAQEKLRASINQTEKEKEKLWKTYLKHRFAEEYMSALIRYNNMKNIYHYDIAPVDDEELVATTYPPGRDL